MKFRDRVYGIENEFGTLFESADGLRRQERSALFSYHLQMIENSILPPAPSRIRVWHSNGSCTYVDTGEHPEHATAECRSIRDLVTHNKAGELLTVKTFPHMYSAFEYPSDQWILHLYKNNIGYNAEGHADQSFGCHENYLVYSFSPHSAFHRCQLIPFLITRQIMDGAGWWRGQDFTLAQRAYQIMESSSGGTTSDRAIINTKTTEDTGHIPRLHLILGDANILETAIFLKIGTTSLVLSLIEEGCAPIISCADPVSALHSIAYSGSPHIRVVGSGKEMFSPHTIQCRYLEAVRHELPGAEFESEKTEAEVLEIVRLWEDALNAIYASDEAWMVGRLDWATKKYLADRHIKRARIVDPSDKMQFLKDFDIFYHSVTDRSLQEKMNRWWAEKRIVSDQDIERAMVEPPSDTRARMRGEFVRRVAALGMGKRVNVDWPFVGEANNIADNGFYFDNPLEAWSEGFDEYLASFEKWSRQEKKKPPLIQQGAEQPTVSPSDEISRYY